MRNGKPWTHAELMIAMNLYCKLPFGQLDHRNQIIIKIAKKLGRTPSSLSMKLCNLASLDPAQNTRGISGLRGTSKADKAIWEEFNADWGKMAYESEQSLAQLMGNKTEKFTNIEDDIPTVGREREALIRIRVNQNFFRAAVLASYDSRCCITGLAIPELLNASHIVPWSIDAVNRINPKNGLCLNAIHDRVFDRGLLTITPEYKVKISPSIKFHSEDNAAITFLQNFDNVAIKLPQRFRPDIDLLKYHNTVIFIKT